MFYGEYSHNLDSKNRLSLPSKLREALGEKVVMAKTVDKCISLYPSQKWDEYSAKLETLPATESRIIRRFLFSSAVEGSVDGSGRVLVPDTLCKYAEIEKSVKIIGVGDHIELWDENTWADEISSENIPDITNLLIKLGF